MSRYFLEVKQYILSDSRYSDAFRGHIHGSNYPPSTRAVVIANLTTALWLIGLLLLFVGDHAFKYLKIQVPEFYIFMKNNKVGTFFGLFLLNNIGNSQLATGAFEIYINDVLVFSKLQARHLPTSDDIVNALKLAGYE